MTDSDEDREPPRLQDTTERSALPLPLPGEESSAAAPPEPESPEPAPVDPDPAPADKAPAVDEPPAVEGASNGSSSFDESPFPPPFGPEPSDGPRPEVLIGAAFAGGVLLALIFRRLGR